MKKFILLLVVSCSFAIITPAQSPEVLNTYQCLFIPQLYYGKEKPDLYGIRETAIEQLNLCGAPIILQEEKIPRSAMKNPCTMLHCLVSNTASQSGKNKSTLYIRFFNCANDTVLSFSADADIFGSQKETRNSFVNATRKALQPLMGYRYRFTDIASLVPVATPDTLASDSIQWSPDRKLTWDDFKGTAVVNDPADALTFTSNQTLFQSFGVGKRFEVESEITCYFIKSKSWVRPAMKMDYLLNHEQRHFDLAEAGAREFRKKIKEARITSENFRDQIRKITKEINEKYHQLQEQYDSETNHSRIEEKQQEWNKKIDGMLKDTETGN